MKLSTEKIRYCLYGINVLFVLSGIILTSIGISLQTFYKRYEALIRDEYTYLSLFLIIVGFCIFLIAALGWFGAARESSFITLMFSSFLLLVFFCELAIGLSGFVLKHVTNHSHVMTMELIYDDVLTINSWDNLQEDFNCCGKSSPNDWLDANVTLPLSCCTKINHHGMVMRKKYVTNCTVHSRKLHPIGCYLPLSLAFIEIAFMIKMAGFVLAVFQIVGIIIACQLAGEFRKGYQLV